MSGTWRCSAFARSSKASGVACRVPAPSEAIATINPVVTHNVLAVICSPARAMRAPLPALSGALEPPPVGFATSGQGGHVARAGRGHRPAQLAQLVDGIASVLQSRSNFAKFIAQSRASSVCSAQPRHEVSWFQHSATRIMSVAEAAALADWRNI